VGGFHDVVADDAGNHVECWPAFHALPCTAT
jgi:hypothetical protein